MRIIHLLSNDRPLGLGTAALRLHETLCSEGHSSQVAVLWKTDDADSQIHAITNSPPWPNDLRWRARLDHLPLRLTSGGRGISLSWLPSRLAPAIRSMAPDVVHCHQLNGGMVSLADLSSLQIPTVVTMHDMWSFTGGCSYDEECGRYAYGCGQCPKLASLRERDWSRFGWELKQRRWKTFPRLAFVAPSEWMARCAKASSLLADATIRTIPYGIDVPNRGPDGRKSDRAALELPQDAFLIGVGAAGLGDARKGFDLVVNALATLRQALGPKANVIAVAYGMESNAVVSPSVGAIRRYSTVPPSTVRSIVGACDVFLALSRQDNLPSTVLEAMAVGTPTIAFDIGGMPDMIVSGESGYLVKPFDTDEVAKRLGELIANSEKSRDLGRAAKSRAEAFFSPHQEALSMVELYESLQRQPA